MKIITYLLLTILPCFAFGQKTTWYECRTDTIPYEMTVEAKDGKLIFTGRTKLDSTDFLPQLSPLSLLEADIVFTSASVSTFNKHTRDSIKILSIREKGDAFNQIPKRGNIIISLAEDQKNANQYMILDAMEDFLEYGKTYVIDIERSFYTDFDTRTPLPKFNYGRHIGAAGIGIGTVAYGINLKNQGNDLKNDYYANWQDGRSEDDSDHFRKEANNKNRWGDILIGSGAAILIGDLVWYMVRKKNWNNRKKLNARLKERVEKGITLNVYPTNSSNTQSTVWQIGASVRF